MKPKIFPTWLSALGFDFAISHVVHLAYNPNKVKTSFLTELELVIDTGTTESKSLFFMRDYNIDILDPRRKQSN